MKREGSLPPPPSAETPLEWGWILYPPDAEALVKAALDTLDADGTIVIRHREKEMRLSPERPEPVDQWPDDIWAYKALAIAAVIYRAMAPGLEPDRGLAQLARYLSRFRHDPSLLDAAVSLIPDCSDGGLRPPQNSCKGFWQSRLIKMRSR